MTIKVNVIELNYDITGEGKDNNERLLKNDSCEKTIIAVLVYKKFYIERRYKA